MSALNSTWTGDANPAAINNINYFDGWNLNNSISAGFSFNLDQF
jgi:hypothetical protein